MARARLIAYYLPQFHPIPENDGWWGEGFTEWTNVRRARPLFPGHRQPRAPGRLGYYDLRDPGARIAQAELARRHGVEGFAYWHYWFGDGRRLLERPFEEVLGSGSPDFPFCLAWANQSWTGIWHGAPDRVLVEQRHPGPADEERHFEAVLPAFRDPRYIRVEGRPLFVVQAPLELPRPAAFAATWRRLAERAGLPGLFLVGVAWRGWEPEPDGFDASVIDNPATAISGLRWPRDAVLRRLERLTGFRVSRALERARRRPQVFHYAAAARHALPPLATRGLQLPCVIPDWDNTPRAGVRGVVWQGSTPELFAAHLAAALGQVAARVPERRLVFLKSWNEWAEGNYVEPDRDFGTGYLEAIAAHLAPLR